MPEIKNTFTQGKMDKDLDERIIPNGQYRDAMNVQVSTSEGSDIGTVQNILGNTSVESVVPSNFKCVGSIANEKNNKLYWFVTSDNVDAILEYSASDESVQAVLVDTKVSTTDAVLKFDKINNIITGINIIDDLLLWTDNENEPRKINIERCKQGNSILTSLSSASHTKLVTNEEIVYKTILVSSDMTVGINVGTSTLTLFDTNELQVGDQLIKIRDYDFDTPYRTITAINGNVATLSSSILSSSYLNPFDEFIFTRELDITEDHITTIKKKPLTPLSVKINPADSDNKSPLFEKSFPRFSYRYKYEDGEYSAFAPFTDIVFNSEYSEDQNGILYDDKTAFGTKEPYNAGMRNMIKSIELTDFIAPEMLEDINQIDILYKQENSSVIYVVEMIQKEDEEWYLPGSDANSAYKGKFIISSENIYAALPENQLLRPWDNVPRKALAQEVTGNRVVYGNYLQNYNNDFFPKLESNYDLKYTYDTNTNLKTFEQGGIPSVKSQRNYQLGIVYGDKYGRETPVFTSHNSSIILPWSDGVYGSIASKPFQLTTSLSSGHPGWADYYKFFVKETSGEYYNLAMDAIYVPTREDLEKEDHIWISFSSSDRNKIEVDDYIILKKKIDSSNQVNEENKFKILDIKNEAPEALKHKFISLGEIENNGSTAASILNNQDSSNGIFFDKDLSIVATTANPNPKTLRVSRVVWLANDGQPLTDEFVQLKPDLYFSFSKEHEGITTHSKKYKVASVLYDDGDDYVVRLDENIREEDYILAEVNADLIHEGVTIRFEKKIRKDLEAFSGRFFVKILSNDLTKEHIEQSDALELEERLSLDSQKHVRWLADTVDTGSASSPNHDGLLTQPAFTVPHDEAKDVSGQGGINLTNTEAGWEALRTVTTSGGSSSSRIFIDNMYVAATQFGKEQDGVEAWYARNSGYGWKGGGAQAVKDISGFNSGNGPRGNWATSSELAGYPKLAYPPMNVIKLRSPGRSDLTDPTSALNGRYLVNGLDGAVTTTNKHINTGARKWKRSVYNREYDNTYGDTDGRFFLHISFLAPGVDLVPHALPIESQGMSMCWQDEGDPLWKNLQGIWGGGVFTTEDGSAVNSGVDGEAVFMEGQSDHAGYNLRYARRHNVQWDPTRVNSFSQNKNMKEFVDKLVPGSRFKWRQDSANNLFTIRKVSIKRLYNHTPWRKTFKFDTGTNTMVPTGDSVEEAVLNWASNRSVDSTVSSGNGSGTDYDDMVQKIIDFGNRNNRRVCYILELDKNPRGFTHNPLDGANNTTGSLDANSHDKMQFITQEFDFNSGNITQNPAIWETEPKDNVDLDIYYETGQAYPIEITNETKELFAPVGCKVDFVDNLEATENIEGSVYLKSWLTSNTFTLSENISTSGVGYIDKRVRFVRKDGSYTTGTITDISFNDANATWDGSALTPSGSAGTDLDTVTIIPHQDVETGLSWYNCFSFGNGIESDRIRDDFNAMTMTNGVRANATLDRPYREEHKKNGLIYSGLYNSSNGVNNLSQFIAAEKITKDLNPTFGSIQKLFQRRIDLVTFCEDRVVKILSNKDALYNADGNPQLVSTNAVLGDANPFVGDFGISKNPESFAKESYRAYFTDKQRGAVLRLSMDGLTPISDAGMHDYFRDNLKLSNRLIGTYDNYKLDYNLTLSDFLPKNLIENEFFDIGQESEMYIDETEFVVDGSFSNGTNYDSVATAPNEVIQNPEIYSKTQISNKSLILAGSLETGRSQIDKIDYNTGVPNASNRVIYNLGWGGDYGLGANDIQGNPFAGTVTASGSVSSGSPVGDDGTDETGTVQNDPFGTASTLPKATAVPWQGTVTGGGFVGMQGQHLVDPTAGNVGAQNGGFGGYVTNSSKKNPKLINSSDGVTSGSAVMWCELMDCRNTLVDQSILDNYGIGTNNANPNAKNATVFHDEIYKVSIKVQNYINTASGEIGHGLTAVEKAIDFKIRITDLATGQNVDSSYFVAHPSATAASIGSGTYVTGSGSAGNTDGTADVGYLTSGEHTWDDMRTGTHDISFFFHLEGNEGTSSTDHYDESDSSNVVITNPILPDQFIIKLSNAAGSKKANSVIIKEFKVEKTRKIIERGNNVTHPAVDQAPLSLVPAWTQVTHNRLGIDNWTRTGNVNFYEKATELYGEGNLAVINYYDTIDPQTGAVLTGGPSQYQENSQYYISGTSNGVTTPGMQTSGNYTTNDIVAFKFGYKNPHNGTLTAGNIGSISQDLTASGSPGALIDDRWYEVRLLGVKDDNGNRLTDTTQLDYIFIYKVIDGETPGETPDGHLGKASSDGTSMGFDISPTYDPAISSYPLDWTCRWQQKNPSGGDPDTLKIVFANGANPLTIERIEFSDITDKKDRGTLDDWNMGIGGQKIFHYYNSGFNNNTEGNNSYTAGYSSVIHPAEPQIYHLDDTVRWNNGVEGNWLSQSFSSLSGNSAAEDIESSPSVTNDGYEFRFQVSRTHGELTGYVTGAKNAVTSNGTAVGFEFSGITGGGRFVVTGNFDGITNPTITRVETDWITPATSQFGSVNIFNTSETGKMNKIVFQPESGGFTGFVKNISLVDTTNYFQSISGSESWIFSGVDPELDQHVFLSWDAANRNIVFDAVPPTNNDGDRISLQQKIENHNFVKGATINLKFRKLNASGNTGTISGYFYNGNGEGFTFGPISTDGNVDGNYIIGEEISGVAVAGSVAGASDLRNTLVIYVDSGEFSGTLDNFGLFRLYPNLTSSTITYNENVKGWISFKSFIPESGLSISKDYYTVKNGQLWKHHSNDTRNKFYGNNVVESTITTVLNAEPSLIKIFNTLNYEGSQSKVDLWTTDSDTSLSNAEIYNLAAKNGWYVESIITDKQEGSVKEFIEKEGKWFNYIKGDSGDIKTSALSFQGLGIVSKVD